MRFSLATLLILFTIVPLAIGLELGLGLGSFLLASTEPPFWLSVLVFLAAPVLPFLLPATERQSKTIVLPIAAGTCATFVMGVALWFRWEGGGPFAGMANLVNLAAGLHVSILLWSVIVITASLVPAWRVYAKYVLIAPMAFAICMAFLFAIG